MDGLDYDQELTDIKNNIAKDAENYVKEHLELRGEDTSYNQIP